MSFFITGTDTGVGKTLIACALLHAFASKSMRVVGMKPVAAGAEKVGERLVNDDVRALKAASNITADDELVNPYCFAPAIAPHIAAREAGVTIEMRRVEAAYRELHARADCVIVEGAGGVRVRIAREAAMGEVAAQLGAPVILVVGMRLGCLNHALLTAHAIESAGVRFAGWVANHIDPHMARADANVGALRERLRAPLIGRVPYSSDLNAGRVSRLLAIDLLQR